MEPANDLGLPREYADQFIEKTNLNNNSGEGVNAAAGLGMKFVGSSDALSELVWSPINGVSLECAKRSLADINKPLLLWNVMMSNTVIGSSGGKNKVIGEKTRENEERSLPTASRNLEVANIGQENHRPINCYPRETNVPGPEVTRYEPFDKATTTSNNLGGRIRDIVIVNECDSKNKKKVDVSPSPSPREEKIESSAENDLQLVSIRDADEYVPLGDKTLESCNSCNSSSGKGPKRGFEQQPTGSSKRAKRRIQEEVVQQDSSFKSWISNMVKGSIMKPDHNEKTPREMEITTRNKNRGPGRSKSMGFQNIFQSLYCQNPKEGSQVREVAFETGGANVTPTATAGSAKGDGLSSSSSSLRNAANENSDPPRDVEGIVKNLNRENDLLGSSWITRFTLKTCGPAVNVLEPECVDSSPVDQISLVAKEFFVADQNEPRPNLHLTENKSLVAMATAFARRIDALKHFPLGGLKEDQIPTSTSKTCFFCGKNGHDIRQCSSIVDETELEELLRNMNSYDGGAEGSSTCLCIKCFRLDHWAISCPMGRQKQSDDSNFGRKKPPRFKFAEKHSVSKLIASCSAENELKENQIKQTSDVVPRGVFEIVQKLRLSRMDILKLMNSRDSLSLLHGFFLRLRLGKCEKGLGGTTTGYFVANIIGVEGENSGEISKSSILVNVGGVNCCVGAQYISNHDFLQDELMAWWSTSGGKIPSEDDLKLKFNQRLKLGF